MKTRILLGSLMLAALGGLLWLDWWAEEAGALPASALPLAVVFVPIWILAFGELSRLFASAGVPLLRLSGLAGTVALAAMPFYGQFLPAESLAAPGILAGVLAATLALTFAEQMARFRVEAALARVAATLGAVLYLGLGGAMLLWIRMRHGTAALVLFLAAVKFTDIGAYFVGSAIGRHKLIVWLSPGKSWEGLFGGLAAAAGASVLAVCAMRGLDISAWQAAVFGAVVGLAGQFGDLCESLLKRSARAKDSGAALPQFGGVLDVIDSPLLAAPVALALLSRM